MFLRSVFACTALVFASAAAQAAVIALPDPVILGGVTFSSGPSLPLSGFETVSLSDTQFGAVSATAEGIPSPALTASANIGNNIFSGISGHAIAHLDYAFEIIGPTGPVPVQISVSGSASAVAGPGASFTVESEWFLLDAFRSTGVIVSDDIRGSGTGSFGQSFNRVVNISLDTNHVFGVLMVADAFGAATIPGSHAAADASVDPIFSFGPGVDPTLYSFDFSPGIGNSPAIAGVPEPDMPALLSLGFLLLFAFSRKRQYRRAIA